MGRGCLDVCTSAHAIPHNVTMCYLSTPDPGLPRAPRLVQYPPPLGVISTCARLLVTIRYLSTAHTP
eukprot:1021637-Rhodomonas_salina.1